MSAIAFVYRPDGQKIRTDDLPELLRLTQSGDPTFGWLNDVELDTGRFLRRLSHRVVSAEITSDGLLIYADTVPSVGGRTLRKYYDECRPLGLTPFLRGSTDENNRWIWDQAELIAWDLYLLPDQDSELDRIIRRIDKASRKV